jgi:hypothetical protein
VTAWIGLLTLRTAAAKPSIVLGAVRRHGFERDHPTCSDVRYIFKVRLALTFRPTMSQIVRYEVLPGLPGEGPMPKHFHLGHPTQWAAELVVRFWNEDGSNWVGNFQGLQDWSAKILLWPEASAVVVLAMDAFYLVDAQNPDSYVTLESPRLVDNVMLDEDHELLFVVESTTIHAFDRVRRRIWSRNELGGYDAQLKSCMDGVLTVELETDVDERSRTVRLSAKDGSIL